MMDVISGEEVIVPQGAPLIPCDWCSCRKGRFGKRVRPCDHTGGRRSGAHTSQGSPGVARKSREAGRGLKQIVPCGTPWKPTVMTPGCQTSGLLQNDEKIHF